MVILFLLFLVQFSLAVALLAITKDTQDELIHEGWNKSQKSTKIDVMKAARCCGLDEWNPQEPSCGVPAVRV